MTRRLATSRRGFGMVELTIVMSIIAIAAAIAVPRYSAAVVRYRLDAAARRIAADLERAATAARVSGTPRTVTFDAASIRYAVTGERSLRRAADAYAVALGDHPYKAHAITASFNSTPVVTFNAFGLPDHGGQIKVLVGDEVRTITLSAETGKADIQ